VNPQVGAGLEHGQGATILTEGRSPEQATPPRPVGLG
jgi:hypothetical protein